MAKTKEELDMLKETFGDVSETIASSEATPAADSPAPIENKVDVAVEEPEGVEVALVEEPATDPQPEPVVATAEPVETEYTDEQILAILKKKGLNVSSLNELTPTKDPEVEKEEREQKKLAYAYDKGLLTKKEHEAFISDLNKKDQLVYESFASEMREANPDVTEEEISDEYAEFYGVSEDKDSLKYKRGQRLISQEADKIISERHKKYFGIDSAFSEFERSQATVQAQSQKLAEAIPVYTKNVEESIAELSSIKLDTGKGVYEVKIPAKTLSELKEAWVGSAKENILSGLSKEQIKEAIEMSVLKSNLKDIINSVANKIVEEKAKGVRGIPTADVTLKQVASNAKKVFTEKELEYISQWGGPLPVKN